MTSIENIRLSFPTIGNTSAPVPGPKILTTGVKLFGYMNPGGAGVTSSCVFGFLVQLLHASNSRFCAPKREDCVIALSIEPNPSSPS